MDFPERTSSWPVSYTHLGLARQMAEKKYDRKARAITAEPYEPVKDLADRLRTSQYLSLIHICAFEIKAASLKLFRFACLPVKAHGFVLEYPGQSAHFILSLIHIFYFLCFCLFTIS